MAELTEVRTEYGTCKDCGLWKLCSYMEPRGISFFYYCEDCSSALHMTADDGRAIIRDIIKRTPRY